MSDFVVWSWDLARAIGVFAELQSAIARCLYEKRAMTVLLKRDIPHRDLELSEVQTNTINLVPTLDGRVRFQSPLDQKQFGTYLFRE